MRRSFQLLIASLLAALPLSAGEPHQSYVSYETGDAVIVQQEDGRAVDARLNLPLYPGDEVRTQRHGRMEIRLADGNVFAIERGSVVDFASILDSYDGASEGTVAQLRSGEVIIQRLDTDSSPLRLDTDVASYVATSDAIYGVETGGRGQDTVSVYDGTVEVRTARRTSRLRAGDRATVGADGIGAVLTISRYGMSDFEDWILHRWERSSTNSRYLDSRLSYASSDLDYYGGWVYVNSYNTWAWRPRVTVGWQPYYYGSWSYGPSGSLVWVSDEPWGWVPYHYGRWGWASGFGWVWYPGAIYSPAWVYWAFGPSYIGWVPAGWYDCWGPYYSWAYAPYYGHYHYDHGGHGGHGDHGDHGGYGDHGGNHGGNAHGNIGLGFYGKVHMGDVDLNHWTFVDPNTVVSRRTDRTSLTTDEIRNRLARGGDNVTVAGGEVRLARNEWKDPVSAVSTISRRGIGGGTGRVGSGGTADLTPFFRRDPELPSTVREHVARINGLGTTQGTSTTVSRGGGTAASSSSTNSGDLGGLVRRDRGTTSTQSGGRAVIPRTNVPATGTVSRPSGDSNRSGTTPQVAPATPRITPRDSGSGGAGVIPRQDSGSSNLSNRTTSEQWRSRTGSQSVSPATPRITPRDVSSGDRGTVWRDQSSNSSSGSRTRTIDRGSSSNQSNTPVQPVPRSDSWRSRAGSDDGQSVDRTTLRNTSRSGSMDIPRRIIDQIGGARVVPSTGSGDRGSMNRDRGSSSSPPPSNVNRPASPPSHQSAPSSPPPSSNGSHGGGGHAKIKAE